VREESHHRGTEEAQRDTERKRRRRRERERERERRSFNAEAQRIRRDRRGKEGERRGKEILLLSFSLSSLRSLRILCVSALKLLSPLLSVSLCASSVPLW